ncbi:MAG: SPOR domain-containing protein [Gammaproteobacteria bacterium]|jgi:cell division protein FtsN
MSRDYKHIAKDHARRKQSPPWVWLLAGLAIGLFVAFLVYLTGHEADNAPLAPPNNGASGSAELSQKKKAERKGDVLTAKKQPEPVKPRFEFYTILPEREVQVAEEEMTSSPHSNTTETKVTPNRSTNHTVYVLQVGSFRRHQDADRLKAELALIGLQADIQVVSLGDEDTWHRVRLGPYKDLRTLDETRDRLSEHNMQSIVLKQKN